jgi:hypothetical protein
MTLGAWLSRTNQSASGRLREVVVCAATVEDAPTARTVEVKTASGHVVRGLSVADAAALLKALS